MRLSATGAEATGLTITDFDLQYTRTRTAPTAKVDATALAATDSAHSDNKAIEIDATDQPGLYRVDWPDAAFATGADEVILSVKCATCFTEHLRVDLTSESEMIAAFVAGEPGAGPYTSESGTLDVNVVQVDGETASASGAVNFSALQLDLTQALDLTPTTETVGDALLAARAQGFGKWALVGTTLTLYAHDGTTALKAFTLDSASAPTSRTPA